MSEVDRMVDKINEAYAKFREENCEPPTHFILDIGAKQALKLSTHPFADPPYMTAITYLGIPIIDLEKVIIIDSQKEAS